MPHPILVLASGVPMDLSVLDMLLRRQPGHEQLHLITLVLGGLASLAAVITAAYRLWRWWIGPLRTHRVAARALRMEGTYHAKLSHWARAMQLYNSSTLGQHTCIIFEATCMRGWETSIGRSRTGNDASPACQGIKTRHITSLGIEPISQSSFLGRRR